MDEEEILKTFRVEFEKNGRIYKKQIFENTSLQRIRKAMKDNIKGSPIVRVYSKFGHIALDKFQG